MILLNKIGGPSRIVLCLLIGIGIGGATGDFSLLWAKQKAKGKRRSVKMEEFVYEEPISRKGVSGKKSKIRAGFNQRRIRIQLQPHFGEGAFQFGKRVMRDWQNRYQDILKYNNNRSLKAGQFVSFPFHTLKGAIQGIALRGLFPNDTAEEHGWSHRITYPGETLSFVAGVFTKRGISARHLLKYNKLKHNGKALGIGDTIIIPWKWLRNELSLRTIAVRPPLKVGKDSEGKQYAYYQLKKGETIYSSVIIRFTDRVLPREVTRLSEQLLALNNVSDPEKIPLNKKLKIPLEWLSEEYLLEKKPEQISKRKPGTKSSAKKVTPFPGNQLFHVILDAGHGGSDPGAISGSSKRGDLVFEDEVVYDIMLRMKESLEAQGFIVHPTVKDPNQKKPLQKLIKKDKDEILLVNPAYRMTNNNVGVNLRVYLVNHIYEKLVHRKKVPKENVLLMSIHGDALHKSVRGAMVYYPDSRLRTKVFGLRHKVYRQRKEYKRRIYFSGKENQAIAESSKAFGITLISNLKRAGILTHRPRPLRSYHHRNGHRTLPAILRYSKVLVSVLVEVANLNNAHDRRGILQSKNRQKIAKALVESIQNHFKTTRSLHVASR